MTIFKKKLKTFLFRDYFKLKIAIRFYLLILGFHQNRNHSVNKVKNLGYDR